MHSAEDQCQKFKNDTLEWSPTIGLWIKRYQLYVAMQKYHAGKMPDPQNFLRACSGTMANIPDPRTITAIDRKARLQAVIDRLESLRPLEPRLRIDHLRNCLDAAKKRNDAKSILTIIWILKDEQQRRKWRNIKRGTKPMRSGPLMSIKVLTDEGDLRTCTPREDIEKSAMA